MGPAPSNYPGLRAALQRGYAPGGDLVGELQALGDLAIVDPDDAAALDEALEILIAGAPFDETVLRLMLGLMQAIDSAEAFEILRTRSIDRLLTWFDGQATATADLGRADLLLFLLKIVALYQVEGLVSRLAVAARQEPWSEHPLWPVLFRTLDAPHPLRRRVADALADPLPEGLAGLAYLDFVTGLARSGELVFHPFDSVAGRDRLARWLDPTAPDAATRAPIAAAALAHVGGGAARDALLATGMAHPLGGVRLEAAAAAARLGREEGVRTLADLCLDVRYSVAARLRLQDLDRLEAVPPAAADPDFEALARMADWLAHPLEFGSPPQTLALIDSRELHWPPTNDRRRLWLVRYRYEPDTEGVGLVGSITSSLRPETSPMMAPDDLYALHCCWELQVNRDPRAPGRRSVEEGRRLLQSDPTPPTAP